ncbi:serine/threonine-protein kinase [Nannocystis bainbridge]|uniref:Serine/threonine-protein kinase n=1 Tax=Nannocystis bainbridge TaxID=2995303 RepID=A0ABT5E267_9BACT|nr:serine/threonine-protein kinase [Nannocystis bainbridge]MDC0719962.1 serine/threonine-protein kinase [Nannocystis bainbridge]
MSLPAPSPRDSLSSADLHRLDQAAWLLARKEPTPDPDVLLSVAAGHVLAHPRAGRSDLVITLVAAMIDRPPASSARDGAREDCAARRLADLLAELAGSAELGFVQRAIRRGGLDFTLALPAARRIRRALKRALSDGKASDAEVDALRGLATAGWESLLDALARSLALDGDDEVLTDVALDDPSDGSGARLARVRVLLSPSRPMPDLELLARAGEASTLSRRVGRFILLQRIGTGAMGVVYAAYDDRLDRKVAIKVLRPQEPKHSARAQLRLLREAQAMARLAHPNVVGVHEVGTEGTDVYVAMEFIRGVTVQAWLADKSRTWQEVVDVFVQAGRGLAAAHAVGLVHRDFKPSNVMIGEDGRARVLDFGLCQTGEDASGEHTRSTGSLSRDRNAVSEKVTQGGEVVGTPAYMPPEQFSGRLVGPASDQFAFCVSLYEALYDQLPFPGDTVHELAHAVARGDVRDPPRLTRVPAWVHSVVLRGLRPDSKDRFSGLDALLRALDRKHVLGRRTYVGALAVAGVAALAGFFAAKTQEPRVDPCSHGTAEIHGVWDGERRRAAEQAFVAAGPAFIHEVWPQVNERLDLYMNDWSSAHADACEARRRGEQSDELVDRRMACLAQRKAALAEAGALLAERDQTVAVHALELTYKLPAIDRCNDLVALQADVAPPDDPDVRRRVADVEEGLTRVVSLEHIGRTSQALELADHLLADAEAIGYRPLLARALLNRGRLSLNRTAMVEPQFEMLQAALHTALAAGVDDVAGEAMAHMLFVRGRLPGGAARALEDLGHYAAFISRLPKPGHLQGLLLNNAAVVTVASGDVERARKLYAEALAVKRASNDAPLEIAYSLTNLAILEDDGDARAHDLAEAVRIFERELGPAHPQTIEARLTASAYIRNPESARRILRPGCDALVRFSPGDPASRARCLAMLGYLAGEAGDADESRQVLRQAAALLDGEPFDGDLIRGVDVALIRGFAALEGGDHDQAALELRRFLATRQGDSWWRQREAAELELVLGLHLRALGDRDGAAAALRAAVDGLVAARATARDILVEQRLARARVVLADVLLAAPRPAADDLDRAAVSLTDAMRWYLESGDEYAWRLAEIRALDVMLGQRRSDRRAAP